VPSLPQRHRFGFVTAAPARRARRCLEPLVPTSGSAGRPPAVPAPRRCPGQGVCRHERRNAGGPHPPRAYLPNSSRRASPFRGARPGINPDQEGGSMQRRTSWCGRYPARMPPAAGTVKTSRHLPRFLIHRLSKFFDADTGCLKTTPGSRTPRPTSPAPQASQKSLVSWSLWRTAGCHNPFSSPQGIWMRHWHGPCKLSPAVRMNDQEHTCKPVHSPGNHLAKSGSHLACKAAHSHLFICVSPRPGGRPSLAVWGTTPGHPHPFAKEQE
jgi:hypothetical protein